MQVPNLLNWVITEPILTEETLERLLTFTGNSRECLFVRTQNVKGPHGSFRSAHIEEIFIQIFQGLDVFSPAAGINVGSLQVPVSFDS